MALNRDAFNQLVSDLTTYYGVKGSIDTARADSWFSRCMNINEAAVDFIKNGILGEYDYIPRNLPKAIQKFSTEFWAKNKKIDTEGFDAQPCDDCGGSGVLIPYLYQSVTMRYDKQVIACGSCNNWRQHWDRLEFKLGKEEYLPMKINRMTKAAIESMEYFAGFDDDLHTANRVRELNAKTFKANDRRNS